MSEQQYEYKTIELPRGALEDSDETLNEYAADGWRVKEPLQIQGTMRGFLLERPK